jgi:FkbM family methyltransferase
MTVSSALTRWDTAERVKRGLLPLARVLRKIAGRIDPAGHVNYAQEGEDQVLLRLVDRRESGFYVDIGAHDPRRFSNTCVFYDKGWRGINIDPNPEAIRSFNCARPGDINLCCGISDSKGEMKYFEMSDPALNTFDESLAHERERLTRYRIVGSSKVKVERLDVVLQKHMKMPAVIDFMNIDAEGHDLRVLRSNDWNRFRPSVVLTEAIGGLGIEEILSCDIHTYLSLHDYRLVAKTMNTLFYMDRRSA